ncbi:MAG: hypothetical protein BA872_04210 [Desulfobacterales bacterium C00003060]|nr:MAG: hypothetical protein BA861_08230 [Desulfobacterales bacterium S3730MH5]OEU80171.1 MAG: hypothetical protein BA872_04210 [Desulfobacterales bacterium C00003060]OEU80594.1 MAG: hypothetical protein BA865_03300 [Desulfobacterales bacterium S5133MH4]
MKMANFLTVEDSPQLAAGSFNMEQALRCPVCRAKFRRTRECSRCGADLSTLMILSVKAMLCRKNARKAIHSGEFQRAYDLATDAQETHATHTGRQLLLLTSWLNAEL